MSIGLTTLIALLMKLCLPSIAHVTLVLSTLSGLKANDTSATDWNGSMNSSFWATRSLGRESTMVILPLPTSLFPSHE